MPDLFIALVQKLLAQGRRIWPRRQVGSVRVVLPALSEISGASVRSYAGGLSWPTSVAVWFASLTRMWWLVIVPIATIYLLVRPPSGDLAAATYRSNLFSNAGLLMWDNHWYGGHHLPAYSLLTPILGALLGPNLLLVVCAVIVTGLFATLVGRSFTPVGARVGAAWLAIGMGVSLLSGRVAFYLGLVVGMSVLVAWQRRRVRTALVLATTCAVCSPVVAVFLALPGMVIGLMPGTRKRRLEGVAVAACALVPLGIIEFLFPEGGNQPFRTVTFFYAVGLLLTVRAVLPREQRALRIGIMLYTIGCTLAYFLATPLGGNALRLGSLFLGPLVACALWERRRKVVLLLSPFLLFAQVGDAIFDGVAAAGDRSVNVAYYKPLLDHLVGSKPRTDTPLRIEVPFTRSHWDAVWIAPHVSLARGWERQLDLRFNPLFYRPGLDAQSYHYWLTQNAISYVALPDAPLDQNSVFEGRLITSGLPYLQEVWRSDHWHVYKVKDAQPLASGGAVVSSLGPDYFSLRVPRPGTYTVRIRYTAYWQLLNGSGCIGPTAGDWISLTAKKSGTVRVGTHFSLARVGSGKSNCR